MLTHQYYVLAPIFRDKLRLFASHNNSIGMDAMEGDGYLERLSKFVDNLGDESIWDHYLSYRDREFPKVGDPQVFGKHPIKDLLMNDNFTQNHAIKEIYRKGKVDSANIRQIGRGNIKFISSISRVLDRDILKTFLHLDDEYLNRSSIRPTI